MEPKITKKDRKLQLSYNLPHRIRCAQIYPVTAPNASTLILYGHDRGVRILWRGGRRVKQRSAPKPAPAKPQQDVIMLDDSDDEPAPPPKTKSQPVEYEDEEDEMDPDAPCPSIIQDLDITFDSPVLHIAVPTISSQPAQRPAFTSHTAVVAVSTARGSVEVLRIPLAPPYPANTRDAAAAVLKDRITLPCCKYPIRDIALKLHTQFDSSSAASDEPRYTLLAAAASSLVRLWRFPLTSYGLKTQAMSAQKLLLPSPLTRVSFAGSPTSARLLVVDSHSAVRIYDVSPPSAQNRPQSSDSSAPPLEELGTWLTTFHAPFAANPSNPASSPARKKILDAKWTLHGRAILTLLEDGEWGFWDLSAPSHPIKPLESFDINGYLPSASAALPSESDSSQSKPKKGSKLAPMTPNTRQAKATALFTGPTKPPGAVPHGHISVTASASDSIGAQSDESVLLHYNSTLYAIPSVAHFWHRATSHHTNTFNPAATFTHLPGVALHNEAITSLCQFSTRPTASGLGTINVPRDFLVSAEHRIVMSQSTRPPVPSKGLFSQFVKDAGAEAKAFEGRDQRMLNAGELDIGGMDRMLDSMADEGARPRRVGFAAH